MSGEGERQHQQCVGETHREVVAECSDACRDVVVAYAQRLRCPPANVQPL